LIAVDRLPARDPAHGVVAGVCAGIARALEVDPTLVRLLFALLSLAGGAGIALYLAGALLMPAPDGTPADGKRNAAGLTLLALAAIAALNGLGLPGFVLVAAALAAGGAYFLRRRDGRVLGGALVVAAVAVLLTRGGDGGGQGPLLTPAAFAGGLLLVVGPWLWRTALERDAERTRRIRSEERAEVAARVHDSVLQTLALIQREPDDPRRVAQLARRQERELRAWLYPEGELFREETLVAAIGNAAAEVEELHGVRVEVASAGNAPLDEDTRAVVLAAREAMANAARFAGCEEISVYAEVDADAVNVFVRDRGVGFDRAGVPTGRRGLVESIEGRMARHGGTATITSAPGEGTEVELTLPRTAS
jgi:signal transduction histidine kinase